MQSIIAGIVVAVVVLGAGYWYFTKNDTGLSGAVIKDKGDDVSDYSAVFVSGGGIYFGKITKMNDSMLVLENTFNYGVVPATDDKGNPIPSSTDSTQAETRPTLFDASKVGIAPSAKYYINTDQVILWYSLKNDSEVVKTIDEYNKSN